MIFPRKNKLEFQISLDMTYKAASPDGDALSLFHEENLRVHLAIMKAEAERTMTEYCYAFTKQIREGGR